MPLPFCLAGLRWPTGPHHPSAGATGPQAWRAAVRGTLCGAIWLLGLGPTASWAEAHRCVEAGQVRYSDQPCLAINLGRMGGWGPVAETDSNERSGKKPRSGQARDHGTRTGGASSLRTAKPAPAAPAFAKHLGGDCARQHEQLRLGPSRGVATAELRAWKQRYQQQCHEAETLARKQLKAEAAEAKRMKAQPGSLPARLASTVPPSPPAGR